jgi:hypothetical protein
VTVSDSWHLSAVVGIARAMVATRIYATVWLSAKLVMGAQ